MTQATKPIDQMWESKCSMVLYTCVERAKEILGSLPYLERDKEIIDDAYAKLESYTKDVKAILDGAFSYIHTLIGKTIKYEVFSPEREDALCFTMECTDIISKDDGLIGIFGNHTIPMHVHELADLAINDNLDIVIGGTRYCLSIVK